MSDAAIATNAPVRQLDHAFRPISPITRSLKIWGWMLLAATVLQMVANFLGFYIQIGAGQGGRDGSGMVLLDEPYWSVYQFFSPLALVSGPSYILFGLVFVFLFFRTTYRAMKNIRVLFPDEKTITPAGSIYWYIVPFASLWKPFQVMAQLWRSGCGESPTGGTDLPWQMRLWWGMFLISNAISNATFRYSLRADDPFASDQSIQIWTGLYLADAVASLLSVVELLALFYFIPKIAEAHDRLLDRSAFD